MTCGSAGQYTVQPRFRALQERGCPIAGHSRSMTRPLFALNADTTRTTGRTHVQGTRYVSVALVSYRMHFRSYLHVLRYLLVRYLYSDEFGLSVHYYRYKEIHPLKPVALSLSQVSQLFASEAGAPEPSPIPRPATCHAPSPPATSFRRYDDSSVPLW